MFLWIVSSVCQNLFLSLLLLPFFIYFLVFSVLGNILSYFWLSHTTYLDFPEDYNPFSSGILYSVLYEEIQVYLQFLVIALYVYFVHEIINGCNKARVVFFDSDLQNTQKCKQTLVLWQGLNSKVKQPPSTK